jgi:hypothetical protein
MHSYMRKNRRDRQIVKVLPIDNNRHCWKFHGLNSTMLVNVDDR